MSTDHSLATSSERLRAEAAGGCTRRLEYSNSGTGETVVNYEVWAPEAPDHRLRMSRSFGDFYGKQNKDRPQEKQIVVCVPDVVCQARMDTDAFIVLACDGIWDVCTRQEAVSFLGPRIESHAHRIHRSGRACAAGATATPTGANVCAVDGDCVDWVDAVRQAAARACDDLVEECFQRGSTDNMTLMVVILTPVLPDVPFSFSPDTSVGRCDGDGDGGAGAGLAVVTGSSQGSPALTGGRESPRGIPGSAVQPGVLPPELVSPSAAEIDGAGDDDSPVKPRSLFGGLF
jgi:serine/threonine protein phosphatase PrpC